MTATTAPPTAETSAPQRRFDEPLPIILSPEAGSVLLHLARAVVAATASERFAADDLPNIRPIDPPAVIMAPSAAFVTLHRDGELRGCMGSLAADQPLWLSVVRAAVGAARDPRFLPVTEREIPALSIDVSVLGPPVPLLDQSVFRPGVHGLIVERGRRCGLLLPEVAIDHEWGVREMLEATCWKAGLPPDGWRDARTRILVFRTARVSEADAIA
jgi:AmmeMemoRadiSam system protein A